MWQWDSLEHMKFHAVRSAQARLDRQKFRTGRAPALATSVHNTERPSWVTDPMLADQSSKASVRWRRANLPGKDLGADETQQPQPVEHSCTTRQVVDISSPLKSSAETDCIADPHNHQPVCQPSAASRAAGIAEGRVESNTQSFFATLNPRRKDQQLVSGSVGNTANTSNSRFVRAPGRPPCRLGSRCYRKNPEHWVRTHAAHAPLSAHQCMCADMCANTRCHAYPHPRRQTRITLLTTHSS